LSLDVDDDDDARAMGRGGSLSADAFVDADRATDFSGLARRSEV
jgi:hypothetical protein